MQRPRIAAAGMVITQTTTMGSGSPGRFSVRAFTRPRNHHRRAGMDTVTVTIWLMMGWRYEANEIPNMGRGECLELYFATSHKLSHQIRRRVPF